MNLDPDDFAFPSNHDFDSHGMSAREYFALHLFAGLIASRPRALSPFETSTELRGRLARAAVLAADELIAALNAPVPATNGREDDGTPE